MLMGFKIMNRLFFAAAGVRGMVNVLFTFGLFLLVHPAFAQSYPPSGGQPDAYASPSSSNTYTSEEILAEGHRVFGGVSRDLAQVVERATRQWGQPNGYIVGQEASGAFVFGLRYGEGRLYTRMAGERRVFWQGPSFGWDFGGEGSRTMMLVYNLSSPDVIFQRFAGVNGSAYIVGGVSMTALTANNIVLVPIKTGVGVRLGVNVGYLNFTPRSTWKPF
jgi:hypothetical protein